MKRSWYNNGTEEKLIRESQPIPEGFVAGRIPKISELDKLCETYPKEVIYQKYIIENTPFHVLVNELGTTKGLLRRLLTRYKIKKDHKSGRKNNTCRRSQEEIRSVAEKSSKTQKERWKNLPESEKEAYREKQKAAHSTEAFRTNISKINRDYNKQLKETNRELFDDRNRRRSESCKKTWSNPELIEQRNEKTKQNRLKNIDRFCRTNAEQKMYDVLVVKYSDLQYDVKVDERYPFFCDFYIPSIDTFIELQAHPSHGRLPLECLTADEYTAYPARFVDVFARRDIEKRDCANRNQMHLIRIYPRATLEENLAINKNEDIELVKTCYLSQKQQSHCNCSEL